MEKKYFSIKLKSVFSSKYLKLWFDSFCVSRILSQPRIDFIDQDKESYILAAKEVAQ